MLSTSGIPDQVIADIVGWSDVSLVSVYRDTDISDEISKYFKDGDIVAQDKKTLADL